MKKQVWWAGRSDAEEGSQNQEVCQQPLYSAPSIPAVFATAIMPGITYHIHLVPILKPQGWDIQCFLCTVTSMTPAQISSNLPVNKWL